METIDADTTKDWYRYHANIGTFYAHRWVESDAEADLQDLEAAERHLARALEFNPEAHFGREEYHSRQSAHC